MNYQEEINKDKITRKVSSKIILQVASWYTRINHAFSDFILLKNLSCL